jgi:hypothetical protein
MNDRPIKKKICTKAALPYLGHAIGKLLRLEEERVANGSAFEKRSYVMGDGWDVLFTIFCSEDLLYVLAVPPSWWLFDMRGPNWPAFSNDGLVTGLAVQSDVTFSVRLKRDPGASFDGEGQDYVTFANALPVDYGGNDGRFSGAFSGDEHFACGFWQNPYIVRCAPRMTQSRVDPVENSVSFLGLILMRGVRSTVPYPTQGPFDQSVVIYEDREYKYMHVCYQVPSGELVSGVWEQAASLDGKALNESGEALHVTDLPLARGYTEIAYGGGGGAAMTPLGVNVYYHERDSGGTWHPYLLTFDATLALVRQVALDANYIHRYIRGRVGYEPKGTLEVRASGGDVYIIGTVGNGNRESLTGSPSLTRVEKDGTVKTLALTEPPGFAVADVAVGDDCLYVLVHEMDDAVTDIVDDLNRNWRNVENRYVLQCTAKICAIPLDMSNGDLTAAEVYSKTYWCGSKYKVWSEEVPPPDPNPDWSTNRMRLLYPSLVIHPNSAGLMYFSHPQGYMHASGISSIDPDTDPIATTSGLHAFKTIIETIRVTGRYPDKVLTVASTDESDPYTHEPWAVPGGVISGGCQGIYFGRGVNEIYI